MKVSVIIPYHNEERYIGDCLDCLEEQTMKDFEAVIVCDHCTPEAVKALRERQVGFSLKILELTGDATGVAAARNAGIADSDGDYIFFLDCDDYIEVDALEELTKYAEGMDIVNTRRKRTWYGRKVYYDNAQKQEEDAVLEDPESDEEMESDCEPEMEKEPFKTEWHRIFHDFMKNSGTFAALSVLGILIRRGYWEEQIGQFSESYRYASDVPVTVRLFMNTDKVTEIRRKLYIKRRHNDPINLPALSQISDDKAKLLEGITAYQEIKRDQEGKELDEVRQYAVNLVDCKYIRYYDVKIAPFYIKSSSEADKKEVYERANETLPLIGEGARKKSSHYSRSLLKMSVKSTPEQIAKKVKRHSAKQTFRRVIVRRSRIKKYVYRKLFAKMKMMDNTVVFESFFGRNYSDSPKYIFEEMNRKYPGKYKYVWIFAKNVHPKLPYPATRVRRFSFRYYYYMARAKYMVFNGRQPQNFIKREGNVFLETWHGTPLKKLVFDMDEVTSANPLYKKQFYIQMSCWDYLVAPNRFSADIFRHAFMYDGEMLETGYPRNDILHLEDKSALVKEIKDEIGIPADKKIILYAPTWRDDEFYGSGQYKFTLKLDLDRMQKELGDEYVVLLRTHYFVVDFLDFSQYEGFAYNVSRYDDIARLYLISDILITDYSSVFFDYANLKRPMLFFTYDLEKYRGVLRGFYMDVEEELPGPMLFDTEEVMDAIRNLPKIEEEYKEKYEAFYEKYCGWEDGTASDKVIRAVFENGEKKHA